MGNLVCAGAMCQCSFGTSASSLMVLPANRRTTTGNMPAANIMDNKPMINIMPFGMCQSMANPVVASATAAAMGVLTPQPCMPVISAPWMPGSPQVLVEGQPALNNSSRLMCNWAGVISINNPGQQNVLIP